MDKRKIAQLLRNLYLYEVEWKSKEHFIITNANKVCLEDGKEEPEVIDEYIGISKKQLKQILKVIQDKIK